MADGRTATGLDRLPWLADEGGARRRRPLNWRNMLHYLLWAIVALLILAGASYWLGWRVSDDQARFDGRPAKRSTLTLPQAEEMQPAMPKLPELLDVVPTPLPPMPEIAEPEPVRIAPSAPQSRPAKREAKRPSSAPAKKPVAKKQPVEVAEPKPEYSTTPWPVRVEVGASGRLVRVGAFSTRHTAKRGWKVLMRNNPSLQRLPALVVPVRSVRNGRVYFRLQMGTSSQAHSAVLCQRMRMIGQSCVIVSDQRSAA